MSRTLPQNTLHAPSQDPVRTRAGKSHKPDKERSGGAVQGVQNIMVLGELALTEYEWLQWTARLSSTVKSTGKIKTKMKK